MKTDIFKVVALALSMLLMLFVLVGCGEQGLIGPEGPAGPQGPAGSQGEPGAKGSDGVDGISVVNAYVDADKHLWIELSNGTKIDAGYVGVTITEPVPTTFTVTFTDYDGTVLKTEVVKNGMGATAPDSPVRDGFTFTGWDKDFSQVTGDLTVTAQYQIVGEVYISGENQTAEKGETIQLHLSLNNCTQAIKAAAITISTTSEEIIVESGVWSSNYTYEISNFKKDKMQGVAAFAEETDVNGEIFTVTLKIGDEIPAGDYYVTVALRITYFAQSGDEVDIPCQPANILVSVK